MATRNIVGSVPEPDELYGRGALLEHLWRQIRGNNILLLAPRRFGKTGVMRHVQLKPQTGYLPVYLDLEDIDSPAEFVWRLTRELLSRAPLRRLLQSVGGIPKAIGNWVQDTFDELEFDGAKVSFKDSIGDDWRDTSKRLIVEMEKADATVIFILDELPAMLEKMCAGSGEKVAGDFLAWFRTVRMQQEDQLRRYRFIVGGSTSIDGMLRRLNAPDKLNDFERLSVEPLDGVHAHKLANDLCGSMQVSMTGGLIERMLELVGPPMPYFIQLFFSQLGQLPVAERQALTREILDRVYNDRVLGPTCKHYFHHYRQRLGRYGKAGERAALTILRAIAESPGSKASASALYDVYCKTRKRGATEQEFNEIMADLECDWYVILDVRTNEYRFMVAVMRDWWLRWYGTPGAPRKPGGSS